MTIGVVQSAAVQKGSGGPWTSVSLSYPGATTAGNTLVLIVGCEQGTPHRSVQLPSGWTARDNLDGSGLALLTATRIATGSETSFTVQYKSSAFPTGGASVQRAAMALVEINGNYAGVAPGTEGSSGTTLVMPGITPGAGLEVELLGAFYFGNAYGLNSWTGGYSLVQEVVPNTGASERLSIMGLHANPTTSGAYTSTGTYGGGANRKYAVQAYFTAFPAVVADFVAVPATGTVPLAVNFTDLSTGGTVTAWSWTFGDTGTSSVQNPSHTYTLPGTYTISLTATIGGTPTLVTKMAYVNVTSDVGYVPPLPGRAIVEIYAAGAGSARWGVAVWGTDVWGTAGWQDVTPESVIAEILWGSSRPELGILSDSEPGSWRIDTYDPERILDPANTSSPYWGDLIPGLPVRIRHNEEVVRQGFAESIGHDHDDDSGWLRVTDSQSILANAAVPFDTSLPNTLFARAVAAISAAGVSTVQVLPPPATDPVLVSWASGTDQSAWDWIADAARQVLWVPYVDRIGRIGFRPWAGPLARGRRLASPQLIGLTSMIQINGLYSIVIALDDDGTTLETRELTPKPPWGTRTYDDRAAVKTPDAGSWAAAVLADRDTAGLRWIPGELYPLTAADVDYFGTIEAVEIVRIDYPEADPPVAVDAVVVGGRMNIFAKKDDEALWRFTFNTAQRGA